MSDITLDEVDLLITDEGINLRYYAKYDYVITWDRLDTYEKVLRWVHHLAEKRWMDTRAIRRFIEAVSQHYPHIEWWGLA